MKKYGVRFLASLITFTIGLVPVWFLNHSNFSQRINLTENIYKVEPPKMLYATHPKGKIEVVFKGFGKIENRPTLIFEIINRNTKPAEYWSEIERSTWSYVKFNGREQKVFLCGTGMREFELLPGDSFTTQVFPDISLSEYLDKKGSIQIGYGFVRENKFEKFWSEPFMLSDSLKNEIIRNAPKSIADKFK